MQMSDKSRIEGTYATWNPTTGCTKVSQGCKHCYAERFAQREGYDFSKVELHPERLEMPLRWKRPRRIFVDSMSDLFHEEVGFDFIDRVMNIMVRCPQHVFMILTKRPMRMFQYWDQWRFFKREMVSLGENIWLGVGVEDQMTAGKRIPGLLG